MLINRKRNRLGEYDDYSQMSELDYSTPDYSTSIDPAPVDVTYNDDGSAYTVDDDGTVYYIGADGTTEVYDPGNVYQVPVAAGIDPGNVNSATATDGTSQAVAGDGSTVVYGADGSAYTVDADGTIYSIDKNGVVDIMAPDGTFYNSVSAYQTATGHTVPQTTVDLNSSLATLGELSKFALTQIAAWKNVGKPNAIVARPYTQASGAVVTPNKDGTITTRLPNGKITVARMPVGKPYVFPDGTTVINDNGTLRTIDASGNVTTSAIPSVPGVGGAGGVGVMAALGLGMLLLSN